MSPDKGNLHDYICGSVRVRAVVAMQIKSSAVEWSPEKGGTSTLTLRQGGAVGVEIWGVIRDIWDCKSFECSHLSSDNTDIFKS
jgi:hypothetical protein